MRYILIPILFVCVLNMSCNSGTENNSDASDSISSDKVAEGKNLEVAPETLSLLELVKKEPENHEENAKRLNTVAKAFIGAKKSRQGVNLLRQAIKSHYSASSTVENALDLMNVYKSNFSGTDNASMKALALKEAFPNFSQMDKVSAMLPDGMSSIAAYIEDVRVNMTDKESGRLDLKQANKFINASEIAAMMLPTNKNAAPFLQKAGEVARSIKAYPKSIEIYDWLMNAYPKAPEAAQALFMKAFTYDNEMKDKAKAKSLYQEFLKKYPNDGFADDTQFLLDNIDKSNEDIIKGFSKPQGN